MAPTFHTLAGALRWALGRISPDSRGDYWQHAEGILNAADMSHQPVAWQERQQRSAIEWGPWYHCTRMRRPDEPLAATLGGIGHQWRPVFAHEEPAAMGAAAVRTMERMGYKWRGGELWAPPIGLAPDWATHPSPSAAEQAGRWVPIKVAYSGGHKMVGPGARWRDRLTGSEWDVVEPGDGVVYSPSGLGGTLCFWCRPVGEVPDTAKRWLDTARADGCVSFCGDSIAAGMLPAAPSASPAEAPAGPTDEDRRTALVKIGQAAIAVGWRDGEIEDFVRDRLLATHPLGFDWPAPTGQAAAGVQGEAIALLPYTSPLELWKAFKGGEEFVLHYHGKTFDVTRMEPREHVVYVQPPSMAVKVFPNGRGAEGTPAIWLEQRPAPAVERGAAAGASHPAEGLDPDGKIDPEDQGDPR